MFHTLSPIVQLSFRIHLLLLCAYCERHSD